MSCIPNCGDLNGPNRKHTRSRVPVSHSPIGAVLGLLPHGRARAQGTPCSQLCHYRSSLSVGAMPGAGNSVPALWGTVPSGDIPCRPSASRSSIGTSGGRRGWVRARCSGVSDHEPAHVSMSCSCHAHVAVATLGSLPSWNPTQPLPLLWDGARAVMPQSHLPQQLGGPDSGPKVQPPLV